MSEATLTGHSYSRAPCPKCGDIEGCHKQTTPAPGYLAGVASTPKALDDLATEILRARDKFPGNAHLLAALTEEVGELATELLQRGNCRDARKEAIQVACVAIRIATEGAKEFDTLTEQERQP